MTRRLLSIAPFTLALFSAACGGGESGGAPEIVNFSVDKMSIAVGEAVTLTWDTKNGNSISMSSVPAGKVMLSGLQASGTYTTDPLSESVMIKLTVISEDRQTIDRVIAVTVSGVGILSFTASPTTVMRGEPVTLSYSLAGLAASTRITDAAGTEVYVGGDAAMASTTIMPQATTTYTLTVMSAGGNPTAEVMVTVTAVLPVIESFTAGEAITGEPVTVAWRTTNATEVQVSLDGMVRRPWNPSGAAAGNVTIMVANAMSTFKLEARNVDGMVQEELIVMARQRPVIGTFTLTPESYNGASTPATLVYATEFATSVALRINGVDVPNFPTTQLSGTHNFTVNGGEARVTLVAFNPAANSSMEGFIREGFIEPEPNDTPNEAIMLDGDGVPYRGTLGVMDVDMYSVEVPEGGRIYARNGVTGNNQCTADTAIRLIGPDGMTVLGTVDDVIFPNVGNCPIMNPASEAYADVLAAGIYYIAIDPGFAHMTDETYSLVVRVSGPDDPLPGITYTRVGLPPWEISDCRVYSDVITDAMPSLTPLIDKLPVIFRPLHEVEPMAAELLNETPHIRPPEGEIVAAVRAQGLEPKTQFTPAEFTAPNGLALFCMMQPSMTATVGVTFDSMRQPMIPHSLFPMQDIISRTRDGQTYSQDNVFPLESFVTLGLNPPGEGLSHRIIWDALNTAFATGGEPAAGGYVWRHTILDINGDGWQVELNIEVQ